MAAKALTAGSADVSLNWGGGFTHSSKSQASGACYVNDVVLAILELLTYVLPILKNKTKQFIIFINKLGLADGFNAFCTSTWTYTTATPSRRPSTRPTGS